MRTLDFHRVRYEIRKCYIGKDDKYKNSEEMRRR